MVHSKDFLPTQIPLTNLFRVKKLLGWATKHLKPIISPVAITQVADNSTYPNRLRIFTEMRGVCVCTCLRGEKKAKWGNGMDW